MERDALGPPQPEPIEAAEFEPASIAAPPYDDDPYDRRREHWERLDRDEELYRGDR